MRTRCPQCGKILNLSVADLEASGGMVICPQCVSTFHISPEDIQEAAEQETQPHVAEPDTANTSSAPSGGVTFCYHCGKHLPAQGLNFCPFCGGSIAIGTKVENQNVQVQPDEDAPIIESVESAPTPHQKTRAERDAENRNALNDLNSMKHLQRHIIYQHTPASTAFKWLFAYPVILLLIAIFIYLVVLINE